MDRACKDCDYCYKYDPSKIDNQEWYECRRYPPKLVKNVDNITAAEWPDIEAKEWCGEFKKR